MAALRWLPTLKKPPGITPGGFFFSRQYLKLTRAQTVRPGSFTAVLAA